MFLSNINIPNPIANPDSTITYKVVIETSGCIDSQSVTVTVNPQPITFISADDSICVGESKQLSSGGGDFYYWQPQTGLSNINIPNPVATPDSTITYFVSITGASNCSTVESVQVFVDYPITVNMDQRICTSDSFFVGGFWQHQPGTYFDSSTSIAGCDSITVTNLSVLDTTVVNQASSICDGDSIFLANVWQTNPGIYYDSATGSAGCDSITVTTLSINSSPFVTTISDTTIEFGASVVLNTISNASSLVWSPDSSLSCVQCTNPVASPGQTITYMVQATDSNNCIAEDMVTINVLDSECKVAMPTAFSPNGDGVNEKIGPFINGDVQIEEFRIYNRWGQLVFEAINSNAWWDGVYKDEVQNLSVYVYYLRYTCKGVSKVQSGNITLVQ